MAPLALMFPVGALVGAIVGASRNRTLEGAVLGFLLAFVGVCIVVCMDPKPVEGSDSSGLRIRPDSPPARL